MNIRYLLKFGKRENISGIVNGKVWLSTAERLRKIEDELVKGQGDKLEGGMHIAATGMRFVEEGTGKTANLSGLINLNIFMEPVKDVPIYCMFACFDKDVDNDGTIKLDNKTQQTIREHFPEADAVAVISKPGVFISEFVSTIHNVGENKPLYCKTDLAHYFKMYGTEVTLKDGSKGISNDMELWKFLTQDHDPVQEGNKTEWIVYRDDAWRNLFCKDVFFEGEQEYRFILPNETVISGKMYEVTLSEKIDVYGLDDFFADM